MDTSGNGKGMTEENRTDMDHHTNPVITDTGVKKFNLRMKPNLITYSGIKFKIQNLVNNNSLIIS